ncbi:murein hydrolase activator EnvC family protein [Aestuariivirga sp.]|jgi:septal ring factor EnvC (AmiA/AmiB activator)|uniref:murein hydrolase activator EnvC family protein n=1 Tax=Aestuariivirga sp. TaxID=2650926 RepID=UPI0037843713
MRRSALTIALVMLALPAQGTGLRAQEQEQLELIERQIENARAAEARIAQEIAAAIEAQDSVAEQLGSIAQSIQAQEALIAASEAEMQKLATERATLLAELGEKQDSLSELLAALQRLEQNPPPALVVEPGDILAALRGAMLLGTLVPELSTEAQALALKLDQLGQVEAAISTRGQAVAQEITRLESQRIELGRLVAQKKGLVSKSSEELEAERARSRELADRARSLKQLLASLAAERKRQEAEAAERLAAEERERKRQEELQRAPKLAFAEAKGKLAFPAQGQIVRGFGEPDGLGRETQGLMIATRAGAQVTAPADGKVEFAGPFRSYGEVVILNPGGGYRVLLAGMDKVTADVGEFLRAGEPVGEMGSGPASVTLFGEVVQDGRPVLYIEFRNSTEAVDSGPWWIGGLKEARG